MKPLDFLAKHCLGLRRTESGAYVFTQHSGFTSRRASGSLAVGVLHLSADEAVHALASELGETLGDTPVPEDRETYFALREAAEIEIENSYFAARPGLPDNHRRTFMAAFNRGWDARK